MESWQWIFIFFAVLMVARIVPRMLRKGKMNVQRDKVVATEQPFSETRDQPFVKESKERSFVEEAKPESKEMMVLGQINRGYKTFGEISKTTGLNSEEIKSILGDLEKRGLMKIEQKKGLVGIKVELLPTEKGYREYDS
jgi:predicted HTH transcriptional regulator